MEGGQGLIDLINRGVMTSVPGSTAVNILGKAVFKESNHCPLEACFLIGNFFAGSWLPQF